MKHVKKLVGMLLVLAMVLSFGISAFAAEAGSVTINGALKGNTFTLYKIFDLESYNKDNNKYAYTIDTSSPLYSTIANMQLKVGSMTTESPVFTLSDKAGSDTIKYVQLAPTFTNAADDGVVVKAVAAKLMEAIDRLNDTQKNSILIKKVDHLGDSQTTTPTDGTGITTEQVTGETDKYNIKFSELDLGYYLVDSSAGTMIGLTTTNPDATINAKNKLPGVNKEVKKSVDDQWSQANSKKIGETVEYRVQVAVEDGATNYTIHDSMSEGLTFKEITKVYYGDPANLQENHHLLYDKNGTDDSKKDLSSFCTYTTGGTYQTKDATGNVVEKTCCFEMKFKDNILDQVLTDVHKDDSGYNKVIYVEYTAVLNEDAVIGEVGNPNDIYLTYGENDVEVGHATVKTYTYQMELVKTTEDKTVLTGAQFEVYDKENDANNGTNKIHFVKDTSGTKTIYRVATPDEITGGTGITTTIEAGDVIISGLGGYFETSVQDQGRTYYFKETKAPDGFTLLPAPQKFEMKKANNMATFEVGGKYESGGFQIINRSGSILPSTGGIGTTIFYVVGSILLIGAAVLLITKKRMSSAK